MNNFCADRIKSNSKPNSRVEIINKDLIDGLDQMDGDDFDSELIQSESTVSNDVTKLEEKVIESEDVQTVSLQDWLSAALVTGNESNVEHGRIDELSKFSSKAGLKNNDVVYFYWFDAYEDSRSQPGNFIILNFDK